MAADRVYYAAHIEVLEADHPEGRFVAALCLYSQAVDTRPGRLHDLRPGGGRTLRAALMLPAEEFAALIARPDVELAELFAAPFCSGGAVADRARPSLAIVRGPLAPVGAGSCLPDAGAGCGIDR